MNILLATYNYYPYNWGGSEVYVSGLATYLKTKGNNVIIIAATAPEAFEDHALFYEDKNLKAVQYLHNDSKVVAVYFHHTSTTEIYTKYNPDWVNSWNSLLQKISIDWDILHVHAHTAIIGRALIEGVKKLYPLSKVVVSYHTPLSCVKNTLLIGKSIKDCTVTPGVNICTSCVLSENSGFPINVLRPLTHLLPAFRSESLPTAVRIKYLVNKFIESFKFFNSNIDQWHVFSEQIKQILLLNKLDVSKIQLLPHGVNPVFLKNENIILRTSIQSPLIFLYVGRFIKIKGFHTLLKAWCSLKESSERKLWVIGELQEEDKELQKLIEKTGQRKDINWHGKKDQEEIATIMQQVHCTIIPSQCVEIGPLVFHEAIASGSDVITSNIGGCKELAVVYKNKTTLFIAGNPGDLANKIINFKYSHSKTHVTAQYENFEKVSMCYADLIKLETTLS